MTATRADIVDLHDLMFSSSTSRFMGEHGPSGEPAGVSYVSAEMTLQYWGEDGENDEPEEIVIARASCHLVNLNKVASMFEGLDPISGELARMAEFADNVLDSHLMDEYSAQGLIIETVEVDEKYRGQNIGPRLVSALLETVSGDGSCLAAFLHAQPLQWEEMTDTDHAAAQAKIASAWAKVGFQHSHEGLHWLHTALVDIQL